jgi:hypothetical protein
MLPIGSGHHIVNDSDFDYSNPEHYKIIEKIAKNARKLRGEVISYTLDIDSYLGGLIGYFFFGDIDKNKEEIFEEFIVNTEFFSLKKKMEVLKLLMDRYPEQFHNISKNQRNEFFKTVEKVNTYRNAFAHGVIIIDFKTETASICHTSNSRKKIFYPLSSESIKQFQIQIEYLLEFYIDLRTDMYFDRHPEELKSLKHAI